MKVPLAAGILAFPLLSVAAPTEDFSSLFKRQDAGLDVQAKQDTYDYKKDTWEIFLHNTCTDEETERVKRSFAEAGYLAHALHQWKPGGAFQNTMDTYMGTDSKDDPYRQKVVDNINREWDVHSGNAPKQAKTLVHCNAQSWGSACRPSTRARTNTQIISDDERIHNVQLCPLWFDDTKMKTLGARISDTRASRDTSKSMKSLFPNIAGTWLHETFHWRVTVGDPWIRDFDPEDPTNVGLAIKKIYGPAKVADQAKAGGVKTTYRIADAYTMAATSMFLMQSFGNSDVTKPNDFSISDEELGDYEEVDDAPQGLSQSDFNLVKAADANINPEDYLPMPTKYPLCSGTKDCNYLTKCGEEWMPIEDFTTDGGEKFPGFRTVVNKFCEAAEGAIVSPGQKYKAVYAVGLDQGGDPKKKGKAGSLNFEINNKFDDYHYVNKANCNYMLLKLAEKDGKCYGPTNVDTKGGTFQLGEDKISYHAIASTKKHDELIALGAVVDDKEQDADADDGDSSSDGSPFDTTTV